MVCFFLIYIYIFYFVLFLFLFFFPLPFPPTVYKDGKVCISILHPPGPDDMSGEDESERWLPTRSIATIILSIISILSAPNFSSPANIDASVELRKNPEAYAARVKRLVEKSLREKPADIKIPHPDTDPVERAAQIEKMKRKNAVFDSLDDDVVGFDDDNDDDLFDGGDDDDDDFGKDYSFGGDDSF